MSTVAKANVGQLKPVETRVYSVLSKYKKVVRELCVLLHFFSQKPQGTPLYKFIKFIKINKIHKIFEICPLPPLKSMQWIKLINKMDKLINKEFF